MHYWSTLAFNRWLTNDPDFDPAGPFLFPGIRDIAIQEFDRLIRDAQTRCGMTVLLVESPPENANLCTTEHSWADACSYSALKHAAKDMASICWVAATLSCYNEDYSPKAGVKVTTTPLVIEFGKEPCTAMASLWMRIDNETLERSTQ